MVVSQPLKNQVPNTGNPVNQVQGTILVIGDQNVVGLLMVSGTAHTQNPNTPLRVEVNVDDIVVGEMISHANSQSHQAVNMLAAKVSLTPGDHTLLIKPVGTTKLDYNDYFSATFMY